MTRPTTMPHARSARPRFFVPEVVQTSGMDCGPAALKCLLEGFGVSVSYGRLREACQTDVDGTSIDTMEEIAVELGLLAEQIMLPLDHVLVPEACALPAIAVVLQPGGLTHFIVIWRRHGRFVQLMDPATGRRWATSASLLRDLYTHVMPVPAAGFHDWTGSQEFLGPLHTHLGDLGLSRSERDGLVAIARADTGWRAAAALDAATRMVGSIVRAGGVRRGSEARRVLEEVFHSAREQPEQAAEIIPPVYWTALPAPPDAEGQEQVRLRGAVIVRVRGRREAPDEDAGRTLSPELVAALAEPPARPWLELIRMLRADGWIGPGVLAAGVVLAAAAVLMEAVIFRGLLDLERELGLYGQRLAVIAAICVLTAVSLLLQLGGTQGALALGRRLEARLRVAFLQKLPRVGDRYFQSRLVSDMAERGHNLHQLRVAPDIGMEVVRSCATLGMTVAGIIWLDPGSAPLALLSVFATVAIPLAVQPPLAERDLRTRTHAGALSRFYLDTLLGLTAIRAHAAEGSVRREHESRLVDWIQAGLDRTRLLSAVTAVHALAGFSLAAFLLFDHLARGGPPGRALLLVYWALSLPLIGQEVLQLARMIPIYRNVMLRLLEPLNVPEEAPSSETPRQAAPAEGTLSPGVAIAMEQVMVRIAGHVVLEGIDLSVDAGKHVAIVGPSGAGKSSLVGLLLGWNRISAGRLLADGAPLDGEHLQRLREQTAWVDPAVQIWNRSLLSNLLYGAPQRLVQPVGRVMEQAHLLSVLERLPNGMQTALGEGGGLVSGGEGQRVRLGRAMMRDRARLVILDEPFRGLDRAARRELLHRTREVFRQATILFITHDMDEAQSFERVIVMEHGRIAEDGAPEELFNRPGSRYRMLSDAQAAVHAEIDSGSALRQIRIEQGQLWDGAGTEEH